MLSIVATTLVALAFAPVRDRLNRAARRLVYGVRATPYEALAALPHRLADSPEVEDVLPIRHRCWPCGTGRAGRAGSGVLADGSQQVAWWPADDTTAVGEEVAHVDRGPAPRVSWSATSRCVPRSDRPLGSADRRLLVDLAAQAGPALRGVGLPRMLRAQLDQITRQAEDLRASRERLASAQRAERRRIERDIHDGAQHELVASPCDSRAWKLSSRRASPTSATHSPHAEPS